MPKVTVYLRERDARSLREAGEDPAAWARRIVASALERREDGRKLVAVQSAVEAASAPRCPVRNPAVPIEKCVLAEGHLGPHEYAWRTGT